jgi:hypothetical protein
MRSGICQLCKIKIWAIGVLSEQEERARRRDVVRAIGCDHAGAAGHWSVVSGEGRHCVEHATASQAGARGCDECWCWKTAADNQDYGGGDGWPADLSVERPREEYYAAA